MRLRNKFSQFCDTCKTNQPAFTAYITKVGSRWVCYCKKDFPEWLEPKQKRLRNRRRIIKV